MIGSYWAWCLFVASSYKRYDISLFGQDLDKICTSFVSSICLAKSNEDRPALFKW